MTYLFASGFQFHSAGIDDIVDESVHGADTVSNLGFAAHVEEALDLPSEVHVAPDDELVGVIESFGEGQLRELG